MKHLKVSSPVHVLTQSNTEFPDNLPTHFTDLSDLSRLGGG